jgi:hypothetical protein
MMIAEWRGMENMADAAWTGQVLIAEALAPDVGLPREPSSPEILIEP